MTNSFTLSVGGLNSFFPFLWMIGPLTNTLLVELVSGMTGHFTLLVGGLALLPTVLTVTAVAG